MGQLSKLFSLNEKKIVIRYILGNNSSRSLFFFEPEMFVHTYLLIIWSKWCCLINWLIGFIAAVGYFLMDWTKKRQKKNLLLEIYSIPYIMSNCHLLVIIIISYSSHKLTRIYFRVGRGSKLADCEPEKKRKKGRVQAKRAATTTEWNTDKEERAESWKQRSIQCETGQALWDGNLVPDERKTPRWQDAFTSDDPGTWRPLQFTRGLCRDSPHC